MLFSNYNLDVILKRMNFEICEHSSFFKLPLYFYQFHFVTYFELYPRSAGQINFVSRSIRSVANFHSLYFQNLVAFSFFRKKTSLNFQKIKVIFLYSCEFFFVKFLDLLFLFEFGLWLSSKLGWSLTNQERPLAEDPIFFLVFWTFFCSFYLFKKQ